MKKIIIVLVYIGYFLSFGHTIADYPPLEAPKSSINELIAYYGEMYGVSQETLLKVIKCENRELDPTAQSKLKYKSGNRWKKPAGSFEQSYGLAQIHLPDHPEVSYEQAIDPEFSIEFLAKNISKGRGEMWTCF